MRAYETVLNAHDLDGTLGLIADDAVFLFSNETSHVGKDAVAEAIRANFDAIKLETYRISGLRWLAESDDVAACVYRFDWAGEIGGQAMSGSGRGTNVLRRVAGEWRVAHEHLSRGGLLRCAPEKMNFPLPQRPSRAISPARYKQDESDGSASEPDQRRMGRQRGEG